MKTLLTTEEKQTRREQRKQAKKQADEVARIESERNQKPVKSITISIEWVKSRMWGYNPNLNAYISYWDGTGENSPTYKASGCGYDKESTVIGELFNQYLKYKLWQLTPEQLKGGNGSLDNGSAPYGIHLYSENNPHYGQGIGTNCYYKIAEYIGGKFERTAGGKSYDAYTYTDIKAH